MLEQDGKDVTKSYEVSWRVLVKALGNTGFSSGSAAVIGFQVNPSVDICKVLSI